MATPVAEEELRARLSFLLMRQKSSGAVVSCNPGVRRRYERLLAGWSCHPACVEAKLAQKCCIDIVILVVSSLLAQSCPSHSLTISVRP